MVITATMPDVRLILTSVSQKIVPGTLPKPRWPKCAKIKIPPLLKHIKNARVLIFEAVFIFLFISIRS